jgi:hypothetical protein
MAKVTIAKETFGDPGNTGNEGAEQMISPLSFQNNSGQTVTERNTPEWPCQLEEESEAYPIPQDKIGLIPKCEK